MPPVPPHSVVAAPHRPCMRILQGRSGGQRGGMP